VTSDDAGSSREKLELLESAQRSLQDRWEEFRRAHERRDTEAYRLALTDFHRNLARWTEAEERALVPAVGRVGVAGRDPRRELKLDYVQIRELTRYLLEQIEARAPLADVLGLIQNLDRRLTAHASEMKTVYYPAAAPALTVEEQRILEEARPPD
jgi:hypothetical protein